MLLRLECESVGKNAKVIRCDGHGVPELLDAILRLTPLDRSTEKSVRLMEVSAGEAVETPIWNTYGTILAKYDDRGEGTVETMERYAFYEASRTCYAIVATGESALYANIMDEVCHRLRALSVFHNPCRIVVTAICQAPIQCRALVSSDAAVRHAWRWCRPR